MEAEPRQAVLSHDDLISAAEESATLIDYHLVAATKAAPESTAESSVHDDLIATVESEATVIDDHLPAAESIIRESEVLVGRHGEYLLLIDRHSGELLHRVRLRESKRLHAVACGRCAGKGQHATDCQDGEERFHFIVLSIA